MVQVSDLGLSSLAGLDHLEKLSLISCNNVSDVGLNYLRQNCKALRVRHTYQSIVEVGWLQARWLLDAEKNQ